MASAVKAQPTILAGSVDQLVFAAGIGDHDFATIGEILGDSDHYPLSFVDIAQPYRAERVHVLAHDLAGTLRHVTEEQIAEILRSALQCQPQPVLVRCTQQDLDTRWIEFIEIIEGEHQALDSLS